MGVTGRAAPGSELPHVLALGQPLTSPRGLLIKTRTTAPEPSQKCSRPGLGELSAVTEAESTECHGQLSRDQSKYDEQQIPVLC